MGGGGLAVGRGSGDAFNFLAQEEFYRFAPIWRQPVASNRPRNSDGAFGNKGATFPASTQGDGSAGAATTCAQEGDAAPRDQEARARMYRNHSGLYAKRLPNGPPGAIGESITRNFERATKSKAAAAAAATAAAELRKAKMGKLEGGIREYGKGAGVPTCGRAEMYPTGYPESPAVETISAPSLP